MMKKYEIGLYEKAMRNTLSWSEKLKCAKECGYDYMEMCIDATDEKINRIFMNTAEKKEIMEAGTFLNKEHDMEFDYAGANLMIHRYLDITISVPPLSVQRELAESISKLQNEAVNLRIQANKKLEEARSHIANEVLKA